MKNVKKILPAGAFVLCCGLFAIYFLTTRGLGDRQPPVMTLPESVLEVSVYESEDALLRDITAEDDVDGDVTELVVVESVSDLFDGGFAEVTYAAFDRSGNVARGQRRVHYSDYESPRFTLSAPLIFREGGTKRIFDIVGAEDALDGSLDDRVKGTLVSGETALEQPGLYRVEFRVTNSLGDTVHLELPVEVTAGNVPATRPELEHYLLYLKQGQRFDPEGQLAAYNRVPVGRVESDVDTAVPGLYTVTYYPENRAVYGHTRLAVVVEE